MDGVQSLDNRHWDYLRYAALALALSVVIHGFDHAFQKRGFDGLEPQVFWVGVVVFMLPMVALWLAWRKDPRAPAVALVVGLTVLVLVSASHVPSNWWWLSDSYIDRESTVASWLAMLTEPLAGLVLALVALQCMRVSARSAR